MESLRCLVLGLAALASIGVAARSHAESPAEGHDIHIMAPHVVGGLVMGPFHHYCKMNQAEPLVLECLLYMTTEPAARLVGIEYFVDKAITRPNVRLDVWNRFYHDHRVEIDTGRVQVLDRTPEEAAALAEAAAGTDGIIWKLWMPGLPAPSGEVHPAQSVGHRHRSEGPGPPTP